MSPGYQLVLGYGLSGRGVVDFFQKNNIPYYIYDEMYNESDGPYFLRLTEVSKALANCVGAVVSPGFSPNHCIVSFLAKNNIPIRTDLDILNQHMSCSKVAVTGTNGKSTVTTWLTRALSQHAPWKAVGNIGVSALCVLGEALEGVVVEVSSAQLHYSTLLNYDYAVILPITSDHLDWHGSREAYLKAKLKLLSSKKILVHESLLEDVKGANVMSYGASGDVYWEHDTIYLPNGRALKFDVEHYWRQVDRENLCAVVATLHLMQVELESIPNFEALPYRAKKSTLKNGWMLVNDSKATNLHAMRCTLQDVRATYPGKPIVLMLGGLFKEPFSLPPLEKDDWLFLFGHELNRLELKAENMKVYPSLVLAATALRDHIKNNPPAIVVFAPGGASLDEFTGYAHRGKVFDEWLHCLC